MLTRNQFLRKLHTLSRIDKSEFVDMDLIYYNHSMDLKTLLDCPISNTHSDEDFRLLAYYYLNRSHNLRLLLKGCAELRHCYDYEVSPVWIPSFRVTRSVWAVVKRIEAESQDSSFPKFVEGTETRVGIRQMWADICVLFKEFRSMLKYYNPAVDDMDSIIIFSDVTAGGPHPIDCKNMFCEFK